MNDFQKRLEQAIPGGCHTYSRGFDQFPSNVPEIFARGDGAYLFDAEGNKFLDYGMALRAVTLGYANQSVNEAAITQIHNGNNLTRASLIELEAAELLVDLIPSVDMVKFAKNGSNVTTAAVKLARAYTGKTKVCVPRQQPFFSFDDWFIGTTAIQKGVHKDSSAPTLQFDYGNLRSLELLFEEHAGEIAAVILEPATHLTPCISNCILTKDYHPFCENGSRKKHFLQQVRELCDSHGVVLIFDEMISGFRWSLEGAGSYFGVQPDLMTFGKAMANGFSVAAVAGGRDIMSQGATNIPGQERTFLLSSTHGGEMSGLGAFVQTVSVYKSKGVISHLWDYGNKFREMVGQATKNTGTSEFFVLEGPDIAINYVVKDDDGSISPALRTLFAQEMAKSNVIMPWISFSLEHNQETLDRTFDAMVTALKKLPEAIDRGPEKLLEGPVLKPVFRKFN